MISISVAALGSLTQALGNQIIPVIESLIANNGGNDIITNLEEAVANAIGGPIAKDALEAFQALNSVLPNLHFEGGGVGANEGPGNGDPLGIETGR